MEQRKPLIGIVLANGWSIKNLLYSGVMAELQRHFDILGWVASECVTEIRSLAEKFGVYNVIWREFHDWDEAAMHRLIRQFQKSLLSERYHIATEKIASRSPRGRRRKWQRVTAKAVKMIAGTPLGLGSMQLASKIRQHLGNKSFYKKDFQDFRPELIFTGYPLDFKEDPIIYEARANGIPVATIVPSWDNLTSKGVIYRGYERVFVWNELMKREALQFYPEYQPRQIVPIGVPRFEIYRQPLPPEFQREPFLRSLGLDPNKRLLLFANSPMSMFPEQPQVIKHLCDAMHDGSLPRDVQLLVRCHPRDTFEAYDQFNKFERVRVWYPKELKTGNNTDLKFYDWIPNPNDLWILSAMLRHSVVSMNPFSTMTLDAAICDIPIANIAYDGDVVKPYYASIVSAYDYSHQAPLVKIGASVLCKSREELISSINAYLNNPSIHHDKRRELAQTFCGFYSGSAVDRLVESLIELCVDIGILTGTLDG